MIFERFVLVLVLVIVVVLAGYTHSERKLMSHSIPYPNISTPIPAVKPMTTVKPTERVAIPTWWTGAPYTGMYVPTVPEVWQWKGSDYTTVKNNRGKEIKTGKYYYEVNPKS